MMQWWSSDIVEAASASVTVGRHTVNVTKITDIE